MRTLILIFLVGSFSTGFFACSKNNAGTVACSTAWATAAQNESAAISNAAIAYGTNPTPANCNALKVAYQNYIDVIKPFGNCAALTGQDRVAYEQALQSAEDNLDTIC